jgi:hypothetical protein
MPSPAETYSDSLLACLQAEYALLPVAVRPKNYTKIAGTFFVEDIDPFFGKDLCCEGTGWVRVGDSYPTDDFPEPMRFIKANSCAPPAWALNLDLGIARCYPGYGNPKGPTVDDHAAARAMDLLDLQTLERAICCWGKTLRPKGTLYRVQGIVVTGPGGVCVSRIASIIVQTPKCAC